MNQLLQSISHIYNQVYWVLQIAILEKIYRFFCNFKKDERKEIGKKLPNEYEPLFIAKGL